MRRNRIRLSESQLHRVIEESVRTVINEISASLADKSAGKALSIGSEGFDIYGKDGIPQDSYHGAKYRQGQRFLQYRNKKLGIDKGYSIYYPDGTGDVMVLKDPDGNICTKPCHTIEELEMEYNKLRNESIRRNIY